MDEKEARRHGCPQTGDTDDDDGYISARSSDEKSPSAMDRPQRGGGLGVEARAPFGLKPAIAQPFPVVPGRRDPSPPLWTTRCLLTPTCGQEEYSAAHFQIRQDCALELTREAVTLRNASQASDQDRRYKQNPNFVQLIPLGLSSILCSPSPAAAEPYSGIICVRPPRRLSNSICQALSATREYEFGDAPQKILHSPALNVHHPHFLRDPSCASRHPPRHLDISHGTSDGDDWAPYTEPSRISWAFGYLYERALAGVGPAAFLPGDSFEQLGSLRTVGFLHSRDRLVKTLQAEIFGSKKLLERMDARTPRGEVLGLILHYYHRLALVGRDGLEGWGDSMRCRGSLSSAAL
ncbi:hypothetical protein B0H11DRAFT_1906515 [Mycena galericulata]|nr:hypothetical protein B0H11DRAFT_1906515 [Mycena galericulata]